MFFSSRKKETKIQTTTKDKQPKINFDQKWEVLQNGVNKLIVFLDEMDKQNEKSKPYDYKEHAILYQTVYDLCTQKVDTSKLNGGPTAILYDKYKQCIVKYLTEKVVPTLKKKEQENLLSEAVRKWRQHEIVVKWMQKVFRYLDRYYTKHNNRDNLKDVGYKCFQEFVYGSVKKDMSTALLQKILQERNGEIVDRSILKDGINLFIEMGFGQLDTYLNDFEDPLITETSYFYKMESSKWISEDSAPDYMLKAEDRLKKEQERCRSYLHASTEPTLIKKCENELVLNHAQKLLDFENSGFIALLKDLKKDDLSRMYRLFRRVGYLKPMAEYLREFITKEGMSIIEEHQKKTELDCTAFVEALLNIHEKYSSLVNIQFEKESIFLESLRDAFTNFVNQDLVNPKNQGKTSPAELLSSYCDLVLKSTDKKTELELEEVLENVVKLFGYISDKDMFQEFYRRQLSKRLLVSTRTNIEAEKNIISKLKIRCGASYTSKLEGMIKDKTVSEDLQKDFSNYLQKKEIKLQCDFVPKILTTGFWPAFKIDQLNIPEIFSGCVKTFKNFYDSRTESRSLKWVHSLGTVQINAKFEGGNKDLQMSEYQACILLLFNDEETKLTAGDVQKVLSLPLDDIKKNLLSLSVTKIAKILNKTGTSSKTVSTTDEFTVNQEFKSKTRRIKIPNLVLLISENERKDIDKSTQEDRKHAIEAAIVRIMKARKVLDHQQLVLETSKQLMAHFKPDPKVIKTRIEELIVREYLCRDEANPSVYKYLA